MLKQNNEGLIYYDIPSMLIHGLILAFIILIVGFLICLGYGGAFFSLLFVYAFFKFNYVICINKGFVVFEHSVKIRKVQFTDVIKLSCENTGVGGGKVVVIYLYYHQNNEIKKSNFSHYKITGKKNILALLNVLKDEIIIDDESFVIMGIVKKNDAYISAY